MFNKIFIEKDLLDDPRARAFCERFPQVETKTISRYDDIFGKVRKPYLHKRTHLNAFLATKKGSLVKKAPPAYGLEGDPHFYFIHQYNCLYECDYCYLQGYFDSPDLVFFLNHEEIAEEIKQVANRYPLQTPWFHAGEFSDSLAMSHLTGELPFYFDLFRELPHAVLELRTKSANTKELLKLTPSPNIISSFSLSPKERIKKNDLKTPSLDHRLKAIGDLFQAGHPIALHLDPIIYSESVVDDYRHLLSEVEKVIPLKEIEYVSVGVVRFPKEIYHQVQKNYPQSELLSAEFIKSPNGLVRYPRPMRQWILSQVKQLLLNTGLEEQRIYLCMED